MGVGYPGVVLGDGGPLADSEPHTRDWVDVSFPLQFPQLISQSAAQKKEPTQRISILWWCLLSLACILWGSSLYPGFLGSLVLLRKSGCQLLLVPYGSHPACLHCFSVPQGPPGPPGKEGPPGVAGQKGNVVSQPLQVVVTWHTPVVTGWWTLHAWGVYGECLL